MKTLQMGPSSATRPTRVQSYLRRHSGRVAECNHNRRKHSSAVVECNYDNGTPLRMECNWTKEKHLGAVEFNHTLGHPVGVVLLSATTPWDILLKWCCEVQPHHGTSRWGGAFECNHTMGHCVGGGAVECNHTEEVASPVVMSNQRFLKIVCFRFPTNVPPKNRIYSFLRQNSLSNQNILFQI